jgi:uncharacterized protein YndB with AHSA1/START domain
MTGTIESMGEMCGCEASAVCAPQPFEISRAFAAPRELLWKAWSERARLMAWFGPRGFKMPAAKMDFRRGGSFHYCLAAPDGSEAWGKFLFREIVVAEKIVFLNYFSDEVGGITRHPSSATWPLAVLCTITFTGDQRGTVVTAHSFPVNASAEEGKTFADARDVMKQSWSETFERLTAHLADMQADEISGNF